MINLTDPCFHTKSGQSQKLTCDQTSAKHMDFCRRASSPSLTFALKQTALDSPWVWLGGHGIGPLHKDRPRSLKRLRFCSSFKKWGSTVIQEGGEWQGCPSDKRFPGGISSQSTHRGGLDTKWAAINFSPRTKAGSSVEALYAEGPRLNPQGLQLKGPGSRQCDRPEPHWADNTVLEGPMVWFKASECVSVWDFGFVGLA